MDIVYSRGTTVRISVEIRNASGELFDPTTVKATIYLGTTTVVSPIDMTKESIGKYYYIWQTLSTQTIGRYGVKVTSTKGTPITYTCVKNNPVAFRLE